MERYNANVHSDNYNISLNGMDFIMEDPQVNEAFNRRETSRHDIIGGTQQVIRTTYKVRDYGFKLHLRIDPLHPDIYNDMFSEWENKGVEVICAYMGGKFNAECIVKPVPKGNYLEVDVQVIEIPSITSTISTEKLDAPSDKHITIKSTDNQVQIKKQIKKIEKEIKAMEKKPKSKKNIEELKKKKDKLNSLKGKLKTKNDVSSKKNENKNKGKNITQTKNQK